MEYKLAALVAMGTIAAALFYPPFKELLGWNGIILPSEVQILGIRFDATKTIQIFAPFLAICGTIASTAIKSAWVNEIRRDIHRSALQRHQNRYREEYQAALERIKERRESFDQG